MKAIVYTEYGSADVLHLTEVAKPIPKDNEVLVKVRATSLNAAELHIVSGNPFLVRLMIGGLTKPKKTIPGADFAGRIEAVGSSVKQFKPGDEVFGDLSECGWGAYAEYVAVPETALVLKPTNLTFESAAAIPLAGNTALQGLRDKGNIQSGQKVLINGASGGVGTFAVQIAKAFGAEVTAVCSTKKVDRVRSIGADHVIDYKQQDVTRNGQRYDLILDVASYRSFFDYKRILSPKGVYVLAGGSTARIFQAMLQGPLVSMTGSEKFGSLMAKPNVEDLTFIKTLVEAGKVIPVIDRCYPLSEMAEAFRYLEAGNAQGKVVVTVGQ
ncbi:MAG: NAD(P)-dependent alcohol dehydrogenase [Chloroflexota bacterium]|nr:NAD(P)-dependent alcohol dehydrogenase [Chloroflexota bacterium]